MSHSKKQGNKQPINDKTYVKLLECESGSFFGGTVGRDRLPIQSNPLGMLNTYKMVLKS